MLVNRRYYSYIGKLGNNTRVLMLLVFRTESDELAS